MTESTQPTPATDSGTELDADVETVKDLDIAEDNSDTLRGGCSFTRRP